METNKKEKNIGVFDSGIGGVTVLREIIKILPNENYIYFSDSKNNPYGDKKKEEIINRCDELLKFMLENNCKAIVIACNTASSIAVKILRKKYNNIPIIAIEPAYKMVYDYSYDKETLVMATKGTIESERFNLLYHKYDNHKTTLLECVGLADLIEEGNEEKIKKYLEENIGKYRGKVKNVVLGCTHYPLVQKEIGQVLGDDIKFFNGAYRLAVHLKDVLEKENLLNNYIENKDIDKNNLKTNIKFIDSSLNEEERFKKEKRFFVFLEEK